AEAQAARAAAVCRDPLLVDGNNNSNNSNSNNNNSNNSNSNNSNNNNKQTNKQTDKQTNNQTNNNDGNKDGLPVPQAPEPLQQLLQLPQEAPKPAFAAAAAGSSQSVSPTQSAPVLEALPKAFLVRHVFATSWPPLPALQTLLLPPALQTLLLPPAPVSGGLLAVRSRSSSGSSQNELDNGERTSISNADETCSNQIDSSSNHEPNRLQNNSNSSSNGHNSGNSNSNSNSNISSHSNNSNNNSNSNNINININHSNSNNININHSNSNNNSHSHSSLAALVPEAPLAREDEALEEASEPAAAGAQRRWRIVCGGCGAARAAEQSKRQDTHSRCCSCSGPIPYRKWVYRCSGSCATLLCQHCARTQQAATAKGNNQQQQ
ncbi:unnamed protein product, partial [Polarella glacialis]